MGLDTVELVLRVEETFGVDLPNDELESVQTVGDLYNLLLSKLDGSYACLSSRAFYRVRRAMTDTLRVERKAIMPSTDIATLLPQKSRPRLWCKVEEESGLRFPRLEHPSWFEWTTFLLCLLIYLIPCFFMAPIFFQGFPFPISGLLAISFPFSMGLILIPLGMGILRKMTPSLGFILPVATVGDLARQVLTKNYAEIRRGTFQSECPNKNEIWRIMQDIFVDQLQINREDVVPEANILRDLGCD